MGLPLVTKVFEVLLLRQLVLKQQSFIVKMSEVLILTLKIKTVVCG